MAPTTINHRHHALYLTEKALGNSESLLELSPNRHDCFPYFHRNFEGMRKEKKKTLPTDHMWTPSGGTAKDDM